MVPKSAATKPLVDFDDLDDPALELDLEERSPTTARPEFAPDEFAQHVESAEQRMTEPPSATYEMLRDSCKSGIVAEAPLDEEQIVHPSGARQKTLGRR